MSATTGGITVKVLTGRSAASLQRYRDSVDEGKERYIFSATRHCSHDVEAQISEWKHTRELHGTQGARRTQKAAFETVDPDTGFHASGLRGTHVRYVDGNRWRKRPVRDGETPTHLRIEPGDLVVKESEAVHYIYAAGPDLANPENPDDLERFWNAVTAEREAHYPGIQESMWLERNGTSGLVHIHVASNATIYEDFTLDGIDYSAGRKMAGALTGKDAVRARFEQYLDAHPEHELRQSLARVGTREYADAQIRDGQHSYWEKTRGKESNQDRVRREVYEAISAADVKDRDSFVAEMQARGVEVDETGLRRGKPGRSHDYSYRVTGAKQGVRGQTLGVEYTHAAIGAQLELKAAGIEIEAAAGKQRSGPDKPLAYEMQPLSADEQNSLNELRAAVEELAEQERQLRAQERAASTHRSPAAPQRLQQSLDSGDYDVESERLHAARETAPDPEQQTAVSAPPRETVEVEAKSNAEQDARHSRAPEPAFRSRLRDLTGRDERARARLNALVALDEEYAARFEAGGTPDSAFEQRISAVGVGPKTLDGKLGQSLHPAVRDQLERRELGKAAGHEEYELAKASEGDDYQAHLARSTRARELVRRGEYDKAAAQSSQRLDSMWSQAGTSAAGGRSQHSPAMQKALGKQAKQREANRRFREQHEQDQAQSIGLG